MKISLDLRSAIADVQKEIELVSEWPNHDERRLWELWLLFACKGQVKESPSFGPEQLRRAADKVVGINQAKNLFLSKPDPDEVKPTASEAGEIPKEYRTAIAWAADDPMARVRHYFRLCYPAVPMTSSSLRDALIADFNQTSTTVDDLSLNEVADLLEDATNATSETMTTNQACKALGIHKKTLKRYADAAGIKKVKRDQWRKQDVDRLKRDHPV